MISPQGRSGSPCKREAEARQTERSSPDREELKKVRRQTEDEQEIIKRTRDALLKGGERSLEHEAHGHETEGAHLSPEGYKVRPVRG